MSLKGMLGALAVCVLASRPAAAQADKIYEQNSPAVVTVYCDVAAKGYKSQGSGSILRPDGVIVTNYHVIEGARTYSIRIGKNSKSLVPAELIHSQPSKDYALLKVNVADALPFVKLGDPHKLKEGQRVYLIGSPKGLELHTDAPNTYFANRIAVHNK